MLSCHTEQPGNDEFLCRMNHEGGQHTCHLLPGQGRHRTELSWGDCGDVELWKLSGFLTYRQLPPWLLPSRDIHCLLVLDLWDVMLCKGHQGAQFKRVC